MKKNNYTIKSFLATAIILISMHVQAARLYVNHLAAGSNNGSDWTNAFTDLQSAISAAVADDEIWVAQGTYYPTATADRTISFQLMPGVKIYGGFSGGETLLSQRNWTLYTTTLSGDIGVTADSTDNSYHVVFASYVDTTARVDGFTISEGFGNGSYPNEYGAGLYCGNYSSPTLSNLIFSHNSGNSGGALWLYNTTCTISNVSFDHNSASSSGGAIYSMFSNIVYNNVHFTNNSSVNEGGAVYSFLGSSTFNDPGFTENAVGYNGAAIFYQSGSHKINGGIFRNNHAGNAGGAIYTESTSSLIITGTVFSANNGGLYGGAIRGYYVSSLKVSNCLFSANHATSGGGATYFYSNTAALSTFTNNTYEGNYMNDLSGNGGAIFNYGGLAINNCILFNNSFGGPGNYTTGYGSDIYDGYNTAVINNSILQSGTYPCNNCPPANTNPMFVNAADPDGPDNAWRSADDGLMFCSLSPARDAGNNIYDSALFSDIAGFVRIGNATVDLGAYEGATTLTFPAVSIGQQPTDDGTCADTYFNVTAANASGYQWQVSTDAGATWTNAAGGIYTNENTSQLDITGASAAENGNLYRCIVKAMACNSDDTTAVALLSVYTSSSMFTASGCDSYTLNGITYTAPGTYSQTLTNWHGCDSIATFELTISATSSSTLNITECDNSYTLNGTSYTSSGTYTQTLTNAAGCDSTITLTLDLATPDVSVTQSGTTLTANLSGAAYQWIDCNNGNAVIADETGQSFSAPANGNYAVVVSTMSCTDTSSCFNVTLTGISEAAKTSFSVYPNPSIGTVVLKGTTEGIYMLQNSFGQILQTIRLTQADNYTMTIGNLPNGIYFISNDKKMQQKIIVAQ